MSSFKSSGLACMMLWESTLIVKWGSGRDFCEIVHSGIFLVCSFFSSLEFFHVNSYVPIWLLSLYFFFFFLSYFHGSSRGCFPTKLRWLKHIYSLISKGFFPKYPIFGNFCKNDFFGPKWNLDPRYKNKEILVSTCEITNSTLNLVLLFWMTTNPTPITLASQLSRSVVIQNVRTRLRVKEREQESRARMTQVEGQNLFVFKPISNLSLPKFLSQSIIYHPKKSHPYKNPRNIVWEWSVKLTIPLKATIPVDVISPRPSSNSKPTHLQFRTAQLHFLFLWC